jgi:NADH:ubiquinone oxidoreductase subunit F (NADH-binding)
MQQNEDGRPTFEPRILPRDLGDRPESLSDYVSRGGYRGFERACAADRRSIVGLLRESGLRGRGGAAFPVGRKWESLVDAERPTYVVANGEEGEPGSIKDRALMERRPHLVLEGLAIACRILGSREAILYLGEGFDRATEALSVAVAEARDAGFLDTGEGGTIDVRTFHVPHSYVAGEETAALQAIEGGLPKPRFKPPRPFEEGLFGRPTLVQNVETLGCIALVLGNGVEWFRQQGTEESPGTLLVSLAGDVDRATVVEIPFGTTLRSAMTSHGVGVVGGEVAAVLPGGYFSGFADPTVLDAPYSYEGMGAVGAAIGSANVTVISSAGCPLRKAQAVTAFFAAESCRQCGPCANGTSMIDRLVQQFLKGKGKAEYVERIGFLAEHVRRHGACGHLDGGAAVAASFLRVFESEVGRHLEGQCGSCRA